ncbi:MAG: hypothetical protein WBC22_03905, partial [Sedimentisphaerales bacterium]
MTNKTLFRQLLNKAISMALWPKAITCDKAGFNSRFCQVHQAGKYKISVNPVILSNFSSCLCVLVAIRSTKDYVRKNKLFMQNKANFQKVKLNVNNVLTKDYDRMDTWSIRKTKPIQSQFKANQSQNKPKFKKAKMNVTSILTVGYENKPPIRAPKKQSQTSKRQKPMQTSLPQRIMKISALLGPGKTNPNKANFRGKRYCIWRAAFLLEIMTNNSYIWFLGFVFLSRNNLHGIQKMALHLTKLQKRLCNVLQED